jgi:class 3 adenylate cyclase/tetratricopeptide (TPR) repeat protein
MNQPTTALATILFTDLVTSTELLQRAGDESAQQIFKAHHRLLSDAVAASGGREVKWLGDGLMVAFASAADAVRCAIAMQQSSRRPVASGARLEIRVGLHAGEALIDEADYFGTTVVIARRLCDAAGRGQILCSALVSGLLSGRHAFAFRDIGSLALKGIESPVQAAEVLYEIEEPGSFLVSTPFVGRAPEMARLTHRLREAQEGRGGLVVLVGEPGIGKTRTTEELAALARGSGMRVLSGRCYEGEWAPPYGPFAEAMESYLSSADDAELRADLGLGAAPLTRLTPALRERLPEIPEPAPLQPDEERFRLLDAMSRFVIAASQRAPLLLILDDLHWADRGSIAMAHHVARFVSGQHVLMLAAYRDVEVDRLHPLADALAALRREVEYERIALSGLPREDVGTLLETIAEQEVSAELARAISDETNGNPFFIREVLLHLVEEGKLYREGGRWRSRAEAVGDLGIPEGVRQVITRRLARLSENANTLLSVASAFSGGFEFDLVARTAALPESAALDAIDEALDAQLLRPGASVEQYDFTHALIRHTLYAEMNPSRQVRLHRRIAEAMEAAPGAHPADLAYQYHRSAALPGAESGVAHALAAAQQAERAAAWDELASFLAMALDLMKSDDARRSRVAGRRALALLSAVRLDEGSPAAVEAAQQIAAVEGDAVAAMFMRDAVSSAFLAGGLRVSWALAEEGMRYVRDVRDATWAELFRMSRWGRMAVDPNSPGIILPIDDPEFQVWTSVVSALPMRQRIPMFPSRDAALAELTSAAPASADPGAAGLGMRRGRAVLATVIGDYRTALSSYQEMEEETARDGRVAGQILALAMISRCQTVLGNFSAAQEAFDCGTELANRMAQASRQAQLLIAAIDELRYATGEDLEAAIELNERTVRDDEPELRWARSGSCAALSRALAMAGRHAEALDLVDGLADAIERTPVWEGNYPRFACDAAATLWLARSTRCIEVVERGVRNKVVAADYRYPMQDGRTALARLCALQGRFDEASRWFADARRVTEEQGARPCRAMVDYDEALMFTRRGGAGDAAHALPLLDAALREFRAISMTGWAARAESLRARLSSS